MPLLAKDNSPGGLAADLAAARSKFEAARADVIERGTTRRTQIADLQHELRVEDQQLQSTLEDAQPR